MSFGEGLGTDRRGTAPHAPRGPAFLELDEVAEPPERALLVDREALRAAEQDGDVLAGNAAMMDAFYTDVRADPADWRSALGLATTSRFAYVASGTWSFVGLELGAPVLTDEARAANFTNEVGVDGRIRFLRNVGGLWLLQESLRGWQRDDLEHLLHHAARRQAGGPIIDVDDPAFIPPGHIPDRIAAAAGRSEMSPAETVRCVLDSLAAGYASTIQRGTELSGHEVDVVHIVGGGSQNALLCQLTADAVGLPVLAGPVEATALGNVVVQARAHGVLPGSLEAIRERLAAVAPVQRYEPA